MCCRFLGPFSEVFKKKSESRALVHCLGQVKLCRFCPWSSQTHGSLRLLEHTCFSDFVKFSTYLQRHGLAKPDIAPGYTELLDEYKQQKNNTRPCKQPLSKEEVVALAWAGEQAAITWCKFCHWLPLNFVAAVAPPPEAPPQEAQFDLQEARRRHAIALACNGVGMSAAREAGCICFTALGMSVLLGVVLLL